jgi:hypothetical protein
LGDKSRRREKNSFPAEGGGGPARRFVKSMANEML